MDFDASTSRCHPHSGCEGQGRWYLRLCCAVWVCQVGYFRNLGGFRLWPVVARGKSDGGSCSSGWPWSCGPSHGFGRLSGWSEPWALSRSRTQARMAERVALPRRICLAMGLPRGFLRWICERYPCALSQSSFLDDRYPVSAQTAFELFVSSRTEESSCPS